jgi:ABC-type multidrug transport system fused ATPase/permease subunit
VTIGIVEEYRPFAVPNRSAELLDAVANMVGVTCGLLVPWMMAMIIERRIPFSFKGVSKYFIVILVLFIGLMFLNERAFVLP